VTTFLLPEFFECFSSSTCESVLASRNQNSSLQEIIQNVFLQAELGECQITFGLVSTRVDELESRGLLTYSVLDVLPCDLKVLILGYLSLVMNNNGILKVLSSKNDASFLVNFILAEFLSVLLLLLGLGVSLAGGLLGKLLVTNTTYAVLV